MVEDDIYDDESELPDTEVQPEPPRDHLNRILIRVVLVLAIVVLGVTAAVVWTATRPVGAPRTAAERELFRMRDEVKNAPNSAAARTDYAVALYNAGDVSGAVRELNIALELDPNFTVALYNLAVIKWERGERTGAVADLKRLVKTQPRHFDAWFRLGVFLEEQGDSKGALDAYAKAVDINSSDVGVLVRYGRALQGAGREDDARKQYERALEFVPGYEPALEALQSLKK